jgi:hypothetical protein
VESQGLPTFSVLLNTSSNSKLGLSNNAHTLSTVVLLVLICNAEKKHELLGGGAE